MIDLVVKDLVKAYDVDENILDGLSFEVQAGDKIDVKIRMPLDSLAPGEYSVKISLVGPTPTGATMTYDTVNDADRFAIIEDTSYNAGYKWLTRYWGNERLKPLEFI